jgi:hypothetical protein
MKILLAVDGSSCSDAAVDEVARRPWPAGSSVKVLTAFELPTPPTPEAWALPINYFQEMDIPTQTSRSYHRSRVAEAQSKSGQEHLY